MGGSDFSHSPPTPPVSWFLLGYPLSSLTLHSSHQITASSSRDSGNLPTGGLAGTWHSKQAQPFLRIRPASGVSLLDSLFSQWSLWAVPLGKEEVQSHICWFSSQIPTNTVLFDVMGVHPVPSWFSSLATTAKLLPSLCSWVKYRRTKSFPSPLSGINFSR